MNIENIILITAAVLTALHAGLMYAFEVAFIPSLNNVKAKNHISLFQTLNKKIENSVFFLCFFGPIILLPIATYLHRNEDVFGLLVLATILQIIFSEFVTMLGNIPINNKLAKVDVENISDEEAEVIRKDFQGTQTTLWMIFHHVRTVASITATVILFMVCLNK